MDRQLIFFSLSPANHRPCLHRSRSPFAGTANQDAGFYMSIVNFVDNFFFFFFSFLFVFCNFIRNIYSEILNL